MRFVLLKFEFEFSRLNRPEILRSGQRHKITCFTPVQIKFNLKNIIIVCVKIENLRKLFSR